MNNIIKQFEEVRKEFLETLERFPEDKVGELVTEKWSVRDSIAHFAGWDEYFTNTVKLLKQGKPIPYWGNINEFNAKNVEKSKNLSWEEVYKKFKKGGQDFINEYKNLEKKWQEKLFWKNKKHTPLKFLKVNIHHYEKTHLVRIKKLMKD